jgi:hypothetical protein
VRGGRENRRQPQLGASLFGVRRISLGTGVKAVSTTATVYSTIPTPTEPSSPTRAASVTGYLGIEIAYAGLQYQHPAWRLIATHDIAVIGASAGGAEALIRLAGDLQLDLPMAVFAVVHYPEGTPSVLPRLLDRAGPLGATRLAMEIRSSTVASMSLHRAHICRSRKGGSNSLAAPRRTIIGLRSIPRESRLHAETLRRVLLGSPHPEEQTSAPSDLE